jgi:ProP effector
MTYGEVGAAISLLAERFPKCFAVFEQRRKPLKLGIHLDLQAALGAIIAPDELGRALRYYCGNVGYLRATSEGAARYDLDGNVAGVVTAKEAAHALAQIAARAAKAAARKRSQKQKQKAEPAQPAQPKRDGLSELRAAAQRRKTGTAA